MPTGPDAVLMELAPMAILTAHQKLLAWTAAASIPATLSADQTRPAESSTTNLRAPARHVSIRIPQPTADVSVSPRVAVQMAIAQLVVLVWVANAKQCAETNMIAPKASVACPACANCPV